MLNNFTQELSKSYNLSKNIISRIDNIITQYNNLNCYDYQETQIILNDCYSVTIHLLHSTNNQHTKDYLRCTTTTIMYLITNFEYLEIEEIHTNIQSIRNLINNSL